MPTMPNDNIPSKGTKPQAPRQPTDDEKKQTFEIKPTDAKLIADNFVVQQIEQEDTNKSNIDTFGKDVKPPKEPVKPVEKKEDKLTPEVKAEATPDAEGTKVSPVLKAPAAKVEPKPEEKPKEEVATKPKEEVQAKQLDEQQPIGANLSKPDARDFTGFTDEEVGHLKQMSNGAYKYVSSVLKEVKDLRKNKDGIYLQHPDAYVLDPTFRKAIEDDAFWTQEATIWKQQLMAIKGGQKWTPLRGFDKQGNPVYAPEQDATPEAEEAVRAAMQNAQNNSQQLKVRLGEFQRSYGDRVKQDVSAIENIRKQKFAWANDEKILDYTINVDGKDKPLKDVRNEFLNLVPQYMHSQPSTQVAADMWVAMIIQGAELREARSGQHIAEIKQKEAAKKEPTSDINPEEHKPKSKAVNGVSEFSIAGFPR